MKVSIIGNLGPVLARGLTGAGQTATMSGNEPAR